MSRLSSSLSPAPPSPGRGDGKRATSDLPAELEPRAPGRQVQSSKHKAAVDPLHEGEEATAAGPSRTGQAKKTAALSGKANKKPQVKHVILPRSNKGKEPAREAEPEETVVTVQPGRQLRKRQKTIQEDED